MSKTTDKKNTSDTEPVTDYWDEVNTLVDIAKRRQLAKAKRWQFINNL